MICTYSVLLSLKKRLNLLLAAAEHFQVKRRQMQHLSLHSLSIRFTFSHNAAVQPLDADPCSDWIYIFIYKQIRGLEGGSGSRTKRGNLIMQVEMGQQNKLRLTVLGRDTQKFSIENAGYVKRATGWRGYHLHVIGIVLVDKHPAGAAASPPLKCLSWVLLYLLRLGFVWRTVQFGWPLLSHTSPLGSREGSGSPAPTSGSCVSPPGPDGATPPSPPGTGPRCPRLQTPETAAEKRQLLIPEFKESETRTGVGNVDTPVLAGRYSNKKRALLRVLVFRRH